MGQDKDETEVRAVIAERARALRVKDATRLLALQTDDAVMYTLAPPLSHTGSDRAGLEDWLAGWEGPIGSETRDLVVVADGDVAFGHALTRMTGTKRDGTAVDLWFRTTFGLRRTDGDWKIVHEHESVPFYMDGSIKAAVDLRP